MISHHHDTIGTGKTFPAADFGPATVKEANIKPGKSQAFIL